MKGYTPTLTPSVTVEVFREVVEAVGVEEAAEKLRVTPRTVAHWTIGYGMPQPSRWATIERFVNQPGERGERRDRI